MTMRTYSLAALLGWGLMLGGCKDIDAPNQNAGTLDDLVKGSPTRVAVTTATQGLFSALRGSNPALGLGILGREAYSLDVSNPQNTPQFYTVHNQLTAYWGAYTNNKQADIILTALDNVVGMTDGEKDGTRGFAKTVKAYLLFMVIRQTDVGGAALDPLEDPTAPPPPIVSKDEVYTRILAWLDEAKTHLEAPGSAFPFAVTAGFSSFGTPATFLQFNRAVRAKVNVTWTKYAAALTDLQASFLDPAQPMSRGAYHTFSTLSGDAPNGLFDPTARQRYAHGSFATDAKVKADGVTKDDRFTSKIYSIPAFNRYGFNVAWAFKRYPSNVEPIPLIKNEELILLRAEANIALGTTTGADPRDDINTVRTLSGGLAPISAVTWAVLSATERRDSLLYEKRYSLMYENGDRWVDLRRYGLLARLPMDRAGDLVWPNLRIPVNECVPRGNQPAGCTALPGITPGQTPLAP